MDTLYPSCAWWYLPQATTYDTVVLWVRVRSWVVEAASLIHRSMLIKDAVASYRSEAVALKGHSRFTMRRYCHSVMFLAKCTDVHELSELSLELVRGFFLTGSSERGWKPHTFRTYRRGLVSFFRWCIERGLLTTNLAEEIEQPRVGLRLPRGLKRHQALDVLRAVDEHPYMEPFAKLRARAVFGTMMLAGLRRNELLNLESTDVDLEAREILVRWGKRDKERVIPMCDALHEILSNYWKERTARGCSTAKFFCDLTGQHPMSVTGVRRMVHTIRRATGLHFSSHPLRHTFATLMLEGGCDLYALSRMMGHSDIKTTTIYLAASTEHLRAQVSKHPLGSLTVNP